MSNRNPNIFFTHWCSNNITTRFLNAAVVLEQALVKSVWFYNILFNPPGNILKPMLCMKSWNRKFMAGLFCYQFVAIFL